MKILFESTTARTYTNDPLKFFGVNTIPNGSFISVGYLIPPVDAPTGNKSADIFQGGSRSRKYNIPANDDILVSYIEKYAGTAFAEKMEEIRQSPKYQAALESGDNNKIVPFDLGNCRFIKIGRYNINWRNEELNAKDWGKRTNKVWDLRKKYGFGKDESDYPENDWRRKPKYSGTGIMPKLGRQIADDDEEFKTEFLDADEVSNRNANAKWSTPNQGIASYQPTGYGLYAHHDSGRLAIRQQVAQVRPGASRWYFVDEEGDMTEISRECANWLCNAYKQTKEVEAMEAEEKAYVNELNALEELDNAQIKQLILDRIIYMVGSTKNANGEREPIAYVNDKSLYSEYPYLNPEVMNGIISQWVKVSTKDVMELNEAIYTGKFKSNKLNESLKRNIRMKALNESDEKDSKYMNLADFLMKEGKLDPNQPFEKCIDKIEMVINSWAKKNKWEDDEKEHLMKYLFSPKFTVVKAGQKIECTLKAGNKTVKWTI